MRIIYEPRGRALEYAPLAVSLYRGCSHGCRYCFVPASLRITPEEFAADPRPRTDIIDRLTLDLHTLHVAGDSREVLLSFTTDPYQPIDRDLKLTREAINLFIKWTVPFTILTKAGLKSLRDLDLMAAHPDLCRYGTTLTLWDHEMEHYWEPHAACGLERLEALQQFHAAGIRTWVSFEPVIDPEQTLELIRYCRDAGICDEYRIGKLNHSITPTRIGHADFLFQVREELKGRQYIIKKDLLRAAGEAP
jgi:DNA repair photolyase